MLVICLLAASFTGCLDSDDIVDEVPVEEEETIEPVGMGDNDGNETTYVYDNETNNYYSDNDNYYVNGTDYLELISQVENLTVSVEELTTEVKELTEVLEEMQSSKYDVPENSSIWINGSAWMSDDNYVNLDWEIIKNGSVITIEFWGDLRQNPDDLPNTYINASSPRNCTNLAFPTLSFYREDGVMITGLVGEAWDNNGGSDGDGGEFWREDVEVIRECTLAENAPTTQRIESYWSTIIITLPEEPVRIATSGLYSISGYYTFY